MLSVESNQYAAQAGNCLNDFDDRSAVPLISVIIVNTNELHHLRDCLPAVCHQSYPNYEVLVVDNNSDDGSVSFIRENFPGARVIESGANLGYPGANNLGFEMAHGDFFAVLNPDTIPDPTWLEELARALERDPAAGLATSKILLMNDPLRINACGNIVSLTGLTYCRGVGEPRHALNQPAQVTAVSGASFLVRRSVIEQVGPFDPDFVSYLEETDLSLRALLAGFTSIYVPTSTVLHDYRFQLNERKAFHIEKNRIYLLYKILGTRTLISLAPLLLATEFLVWGYMLTRGRGHIRQKWLSYVWLGRNRRKIQRERVRTHNLKRIPDRQVVQLLSPRLPFDQVIGGYPGRILDTMTKPLMALISKVSLRLAG